MSSTRIARTMRRANWTALAAGEVCGTAYALMRPDRRWFVSIDTWRPDVFGVLLDAMADDIGKPLHVTVDESADEELGQWLAAGFHIARREHEYEMPTDPESTGLAAEHVPAGLTVVSADEVDEARLRALDDELRQDVPGTDGWYNEPDEFREYTFGEWHFDAATYLVALDESAQTFAGLVRVWKEPGHPRLGLVGVVRGYRRRGVARAMLATVLGRLHARDVGIVRAEADDLNTASNTLLAGIGARRVGGSLELVRDT